MKYQIELDEDKKTKALCIFLTVHHDWRISSSQKRCPQCANKFPNRRFGLNYCFEHRFANKNWLTGGHNIGLGLAMIAFKDPELQKALKTEGLRE